MNSIKKRAVCQYWGSGNELLF